MKKMFERNEFHSRIITPDNNEEKKKENKHKRKN